MNQQRQAASPRRSRARAATTGRTLRDRALALRAQAGYETEFVGYETLEQHTTVGGVEQVDGQVLVKLAESPFYATGGGQIADSGVDRVRGRRLPSRASPTSCASAPTRPSCSRSSRAR